ncbi:hypothetical protein SAMN05446935_9816 [Burkholderia sp. YR290]|nr:hypothetical protein SAMN05446935_9816 [Burkholderia sp. YR290]
MKNSVAVLLVLPAFPVALNLITAFPVHAVQPLDPPGGPKYSACISRPHDAETVALDPHSSTRNKKVFNYYPCWDFNRAANWHREEPAKPHRDWDTGPEVTFLKHGGQITVQVKGWFRPAGGISSAQVFVELKDPTGSLLCSIPFPAARLSNGANGPLPPGDAGGNPIPQPLPPGCATVDWKQIQHAQLRLAWN